MHPSGGGNVNDQTNKTNNKPRASIGRRPVRWLTLLVGLGVILVSGTVVADVILAYTANNSIGPNISSPFLFIKGGNYASASSLGVATDVFPGAAVNGVTVTTTLAGIQSVPVGLLDVNEFAVGASATPASASIKTPYVPSPAVVAIAGVVCAYAFVTNGAPAFGVAPVAGAPAGCGATMPTVASVSAGCGVVATAVTVVNLLSGTLAGALTCAVASGTAASSTLLYVSYWVTTNAAVSGTTSVNAFVIPVTLP
ncbi:MAG: hypothetical protein L3K19_04615 [Thermoplasmata archaeon]|nr:hypothetical protein [Thermoplasmata archaeon]